MQMGEKKLKLNESIWMNLHAWCLNAKKNMTDAEWY